MKKSTDPFILPIPGIFQVTDVTQSYGTAYITKWLWLWVILPQAAEIKSKIGEVWKYQQTGSDLKKQPRPGSFFCPSGPETNQPTPLRCWQPSDISKKGPNTSTWPRKPLCSHRLETPSSPHRLAWGNLACRNSFHPSESSSRDHWEPVCQQNKKTKMNSKGSEN